MSAQRTNYEVEIMPNGKWRNMRPDYIVFNDHIKEGIHRCPECKCSFCQEPSVVTLPFAKNKTDGRLCGLMYCLECFTIEYQKQQQKEKEEGSTNEQ